MDKYDPLVLEGDFSKYRLNGRLCVEGVLVEEGGVRVLQHARVVEGGHGGVWTASFGVAVVLVWVLIRRRLRR